jgi:hypothetical protein
MNIYKNEGSDCRDLAYKAFNAGLKMHSEVSSLEIIEEFNLWWSTVLTDDSKEEMNSNYNKRLHIQLHNPDYCNCSLEYGYQWIADDLVCSSCKRKLSNEMTKRRTIAL